MGGSKGAQLAAKINRYIYSGTTNANIYMHLYELLYSIPEKGERFKYMHMIL
jgi:hypothetical protein